MEKCEEYKIAVIEIISTTVSNILHFLLFKEIIFETKYRMNEEYVLQSNI